MKKSILDYNIYNSINPDTIVPTPSKPMPFPLENFDEEISTAYQKVDRILKKLEAACQNPVNESPARKRRLKSLKYKTKTCLQLLKEISTATNDLCY
jgi:hypothetical protein